MATAKNLPEFEQALEPVRAFNQLALDGCAKMVEMNLTIAKRYSDMTLANVRELVELKDPAAMQAYVAKQPEAMKAFADTARADAEAALKLSMNYFEEAGKLVAANSKKAA